MRKTFNLHIVYALLSLVALLMVSCASKRKAVVETRTQVVRLRDTVRIADTLTSTETTIIQEADSATLSRYGIRQNKPGVSWIIRQTSSTRSASTSRTVRDRDSARVDSSGMTSFPGKKGGPVRIWKIPMVIGLFITFGTIIAFVAIIVLRLRDAWARRTK